MTELESFLIGFVIGQVAFSIFRSLIHRRRTYRFVDAIAAVQRDHSARIYQLEHATVIPHPTRSQDLVESAYTAGFVAGVQRPLAFVFAAIDRIFRRT